jgi:hypothetical protein
MKTIFVPQKDFVLKDLQKKHKDEQVLVRIQAPNGKTLDLNLSPTGISITVAELRETCEASHNKEFAMEKLESIKGLGDNVELAITADQMQKLVAPTPAVEQSTKESTEQSTVEQTAVE